MTLECEKNKYSFLLFIVIFFQFFGLKLYGVIDVQILVLLFAVLLYSQKKLPALSTQYFSSILVLFSLLSYSLIVLLVSDYPSYFEFFRLFRALISSVLLYLLFYSVRVDFYKIATILISIIFIHAMFIILEVLFPSVGAIMKNIVGFDKVLVNTRGFGLLSSYDAAGAYLIIGMILSNALYRLTDKLKYMLIMLFFFISGFATGRTFMVVGSVFAILFMGRYLLKSKLSLSKLYLILLFGVSGAVVLIYALPLLMNAFLFLSGEELVVSSENFKDTGYYVGTLSTLQSHMILPNSVTEIIFGTGDTLVSGDIGYFKIIYSFGMIGLMLYITYFYVIYSFIKFKVSSFNKKIIILPLLLLFLIYNFKMQVFLSRGFHEVFLIIILSLLYTNRKCRLR